MGEHRGGEQRHHQKLQESWLVGSSGSWINQQDMDIWIMPLTADLVQNPESGFYGGVITLLRTRYSAAVLEEDKTKTDCDVCVPHSIPRSTAHRTIYKY